MPLPVPTVKLPSRVSTGVSVGFVSVNGESGKIEKVVAFLGITQCGLVTWAILYHLACSNRACNRIVLEGNSHFETHGVLDRHFEF